MSSQRLTYWEDILPVSSDDQCTVCYRRDSIDDRVTENGWEHEDDIDIGGTRTCNPECSVSAATTTIAAAQLQQLQEAQRNMVREMEEAQEALRDIALPSDERG